MVDQKPTISAYNPAGSTFLDRVVYEAVGATSYSGMPLNQRTAVSAVVDERFNFVYQRATRLLYGDTNEPTSDELPTEFQILFAEESIFGVIRALEGQKAAEQKRGLAEIERLWESVISNYSPETPSTDSVTTKAAIDRYVTAMTLRLKDRVLVPSHQIDDHTKTAWIYIWNWARWPFRRREGTFTFETDGTLIASGEIATFKIDQLATRYFYYTDLQNAVCRWVDPDTLSRMRVRYGSETGRPVAFRIEDSWVSGSGHSKSIILIPTPDQQYTVNGAVLVQAPTLDASRTEDDVFSALPPEFHPILWDMVAGRVLQQFDRGDGRSDMGSSYRRNAEKMLENFGNEFADQGQLGIDYRPTDSMGVISQLPTMVQWEGW